MWPLSASGTSSVGLIAGRGEFPLLFAKAAFSLKKKVVLFGVEGQTDRRVEDFVAEAHYVKLGELSRLTELLKNTKVRQVVLAGGIPKKEIYNPEFQIDEAAKGLIQKTENKGDDHLLRAFQVFLKVQCGVSILDARKILKHTTAEKGILTRRTPTPEEWDDLRFGWKVAKGIGRLDIGQTVVVKKGIVLAVEAIEGTDAAIRRGAELAKGEAIVVKVSKPGQDLRFDLPCVGSDTLENLKANSCRVLGLEAGKTIMIFKEKLIEMADRENISIVGI